MSVHPSYAAYFHPGSRASEVQAAIVESEVRMLELFLRHRRESRQPWSLTVRVPVGGGEQLWEDRLGAWDLLVHEIVLEPEGWMSHSRYLKDFMMHRRVRLDDAGAASMIANLAVEFNVAPMALTSMASPVLRYSDRSFDRHFNVWISQEEAVAVRAMSAPELLERERAKERELSEYMEDVNVVLELDLAGLRRVQAARVALESGGVIV